MLIQIRKRNKVFYILVFIYLHVNISKKCNVAGKEQCAMKIVILSHLPIGQ